MSSPSPLRSPDDSAPWRTGGTGIDQIPGSGTAQRLARAARRARFTVVPRMRSRAPKVPFIALVSMILISGVVGLLLFNTSMQQASFARTSLQDQADLLSARQETLTLQLADLGDPQRVAQKARRLGMVPATDTAFLDLRNGKVVGDAAPATDDLPLRIAPWPAAKPEALEPRVKHVTVRAKNGAWARKHAGTDNAGQSGANRTGSGDTGRASSGERSGGGTNE